MSGFLYQFGSGGGGSPTGPASGDLGGTYPGPMVIGIKGILVPTPSGTNTVLQYNSGAFTWATVSGGSFTAGGDLSGTSSSQTVIRINGATVPAAGALTIGNAAYVSGASALTYSALNLAGGSGWVTGTLPAGNQAAQTMGGDVTGTTAASVVAKINGTTVSASPSANTVLVATSTTASAWQTIVNAQIGAAAAIAVTKLAAGTSAQLLLNNATPAPTWTTISGDSTISNTGVITNTKINGTTVSAGGALTTGNAAYVSGISATTYSALNLAGGSGWVSGVLPTGNQASQTMAGDVTGTTAASTVIQATGSGGTFTLLGNAATVQWVAGASSPLLTQATAASDVATQDITITSQAPFASAVTNKTPGNILLSIPANVSGNFTKFVKVQQSGVDQWLLGAAVGTNTAINAIYCGAVGSQTSANYVIAATSAVTQINAATTLQLTIGNVVFGNFTNSQFSLTTPTLGFTKGVSAPKISQDTPTTDVATNTLLIVSQSAFASAATNVNGGHYHIQSGSAKTNGTTGLRGSIRLQIGASATTGTIIEAVETIVGQQSVALCQLGAGISSTQMPSGTGNGVIYIANAATNPTANAVGGGIQYSSAGAQLWRGSSGTTTTIAPA